MLASPRALRFVLAFAMALLMVVPAASAVIDSGPEEAVHESEPGQFMGSPEASRTPYYLKMHSSHGEAFVNGYLSPAALTWSDWTSEIYAPGPAAPRTLLTRVGEFTFVIESTTDDVRLRVQGIEHVSIWARSDERVRDAKFTIRLQRNDLEMHSMETEIDDLGDTPKEMTVSDYPTFLEPIDFNPGDQMSVEVLYTAASRVGTGPAPDCDVLLGSPEFPSRIELEAIPMDLDVSIPNVGIDSIQVRGRVQDTSDLDPKREMDFNLHIMMPLIGTIDPATIELQNINVNELETIIIWKWYYNRTYTPEGLYRFQLDVSYRVEGINYTNSTFKRLGFTPEGRAYVDSDGDGYSDESDAFPQDPTEWRDSDGDGHGDNSDEFPQDGTEWRDTDGDGHGDNSDDFPLDGTEWCDSDDDGHGDNCDAFPHDATEWWDSDGDGHGDNIDAFPHDPDEWRDTDGDGHGDNSDVFPGDATEWLDSDGDGYGDNIDAFPMNSAEWSDIDRDGHGDNSDEFPNDGTEWTDNDGDGIGDNSDAFPRDASEWSDSDGDGHGDNSDEFPFDITEWLDSDGDGRGDNSDAFIFDSTEWSDADGDGHGDNSDDFPSDFSEWIDTDDDGHGDNSDVFPRDSTEWSDSDGDDVGDNSDAFPNDPAASKDTDGDQHPDMWNPGKDAGASTTGLTLDHHPYDSRRWKAAGESQPTGGLSDEVTILLFAIMLVVILVLIVQLVRRRGKNG
jgi:hypothetical protein